MKIVYTDIHVQHHPPYQFLANGMFPYPEVPGRMDVILEAVREAGLGEVIPPSVYSMEPIEEVHDSGFLQYLEGVYDAWVRAGGGSDAGLIPDTFAMRTLRGRPEDLVHQVGYYCFETQTPVMERTFEVAREASFCALTGADLLLSGDRSAYVLCRPPGHHAGRDIYGGYCYLNHTAIAGNHLAKHSRVAILDLDYHHGNGTQSIFYETDAVMFASIHADPNRKYPFFSGFEDEKGEGAGLGHNWNYPLGPGVDEAEYLGVLDGATEKIQAFDPEFLVISLGADIYRNDPLGDFDLAVDSFGAIGGRLRGLRLPTLILQEGGYDLETVGECVALFLQAIEHTP
jgi:acetoin utilization deacetylase AcuC-like enzyme